MPERLVTSAICQNESFARRTLPYMFDELFDDPASKAVFGTVKKYWDQYSCIPPLQAIQIELGRATLSEHDYQGAMSVAEDAFASSPAYHDAWLMETAEKWARAQSMRHAIRSSLDLLDTPDRHGEIAEKVRLASNFVFSASVGHDYVRDAQARYDYYTQNVYRIPLALSTFNKATCGGFPRKTLNIFQAGPNVGKTFIMTYLAAEHLRAGYNVLYLSMEIAEMEIGRRIDANLTGINIEQLNRGQFPKAKFDLGINKFANHTGRLKVREFPTKGAGVAEFEAYLNDLATRENFKPDVIYVDYVGICKSTTVKDGSNPYVYVGAITAELRGMAVRHDVPVVSAVQFNRAGGLQASAGDGENDMSKVADSYAVAFNADAIYALRIQPEAPEILRVGHAKSRYMRCSAMPHWTVGIDYNYMRLFDLGGDSYNFSCEPPDNDMSVDEGCDYILPGTLDAT